MQRVMQSLPSSRRSPSLPWVVLSFDMNLKNFPKKLNSKTSCLRITVPENLDLALEGLIRKVLREQPKIDDIYAFAADYFDMLLKIRDKIGTKFAADQLCPFHNDEDAHEMIKLANMFAKPENLETKMSGVEKTENADAKAKRKEFSKSTGKSDNAVQNVKQPLATYKKPERIIGKKKEQKLNETKLDRPKKLKLEPKTEDIGDDEEFLKSDSIKLLVEKELMDAAKSQSKDKEKGRKDGAGAQQNGKPEEAAANEELSAVADKDYIKTEVKRTDEVTSKANEEKSESQSSAKDKKDVKEEENNKALGEAIEETLDSKKGATIEEIEKELRDDTKGIYEEANTEIRADNLEIKTEKDHVKSIERTAAEEETQKPVENEIEMKAIIKDITHQERPKETTEAQNAAENKSLQEKMGLEDLGKDERAAKEETQDTAKNKITKEPPLTEVVNHNSEELCSVVDILNIKFPEKNESNTEQVKEAKAEEQNSNKEEGINEVKIKTEEVITNEDKGEAQTQDSVKAFEKQQIFANKAEEMNILISPNEKKTQQEQQNFIPEKVIDELSDTTNSAEELKLPIDPSDAKSEDKATVKEEEIEKIDLEETKPLLSEDQKLTEDNLKGKQDNDKVQISKVTADDPVPEEKVVREERKTVVKNERSKGVEEQLQFKENLTELENMPKKAEGAKGSEIEPENKDTEFGKSSKIKEEALQQIKAENKAEEPIQNHEKTEDKEFEVNSVKNNQKLSGEPSGSKEEQTNLAEVTEQPKVEKLKAKEEIQSVKEVEDKMRVRKEENVYEKQKGKDNVTEAVGETDIVEKVDHAVEALLKDPEKEKRQIMQESIKPSDELEKQEIAKINAVESTGLVDTNEIPEQLTEEVELNLTPSEDQLCAVVDSQHVIKVEEAEKLPEENSHPESVQIKTIQTHYYDTLQVPEQITKEYRVHSVENGNAVDNSLKNSNVVLSSDKEQVTEISVPSLDLPKQADQELYKKDLEDSLMTPSSNYSLNVSELSIQTISEMFLDNEKQYSGLDKEERVYVTKTGEKCGDEGRKEKREVEEIIHKTIVPSPVKAIPVAPRNEVEINEEANVESSFKSEKKHEPFVDSNERASSSNEGRSTDSDTPFISVEVKTVIETQNLEDEDEEKDGGGPAEGDESDMQIRIEATIDVREAVIVDVREEKEYKDEVRQHASNEPSTSETVPKNSQTSSGESESTMSSTATEIKRNDSTKKHFSSTRTLITTQSLDFDKRNPLLKTRSLSSFRQGVIDFEVWNAIEKELEEAATKIQSNFRGYKTRKKLQRENAVQITTEESSCSTTPVEPEPEMREEWQQSTGEFHDSIVLSEYPR